MVDTDSLVGWIKEKPTASRYLSAARALSMEAPAGWPHLRVAVLRNFTVEPLDAYLTVKAAAAGLAAEVRLSGYDTAMRDALTADSWLWDYRPDLVIVALSLELLAPTFVNRFLTLSAAEATEALDQVTASIRQLVAAIRERTTASIAIHNFTLPMQATEGLLEASSTASLTNRIRWANHDLVALAEGMRDVVIVDLERMAERTPIDARNWLIARAPFTPALLEQLSDAEARILRARTGSSRKVLVLDCDNTLWGGIVGEDGIGGIHLGEGYPGAAYVGLQEAALNLSRRGVLLALCSANNQADVDEVFARHPAMVLRKTDISASRVNWTDKATNLRTIANDLNLGLDALVFVDDDPHQCDLIRKLLPSVTVVELPSDPSQLRAAIESLDCFDGLGQTQEDRRRAALYREEQAREAARESATSLDAYYRSLEMVVEVAPIDELSASRMAQLTQKTNQFNLTTRRYPVEQLLWMARRPGVGILSLRVRDRFGDAGLVGVGVIMPGAHAGEAEIDTLLLSCRVLGRGVEDVLLHAIVERAKAMGYRTLRGTYIPTARNQAVASFYPDRGFAPDAAASGWILPLENAAPKVPEWFAAVRLPGAVREGALA